MIYTKYEEAVDLDKGYYHGVYVLLNFNEQDGVDIKQGHAQMEANQYKEDMEEVILDNERQIHWRMVLGDNYRGIYDEKHFYIQINGMYT